MISFRCLLAIVLLPLIVRGDGFFLEDQDSNYRCECAVRRDGRFFVWENRVDNMECTVLTKMGLDRRPGHDFFVRASELSRRIKSCASGEMLQVGCSYENRCRGACRLEVWIDGRCVKFPLDGKSFQWCQNEVEAFLRDCSESATRQKYDPSLVFVRRVLPPAETIVSAQYNDIVGSANLYDNVRVVMEASCMRPVKSGDIELIPPQARGMSDVAIYPYRLSLDSMEQYEAMAETGKLLRITGVVKGESLGARLLNWCHIKTQHEERDDSVLSMEYLSPSGEFVLSVSREDSVFLISFCCGVVAVSCGKMIEGKTVHYDDWVPPVDIHEIQSKADEYLDQLIKVKRSLHELGGIIGEVDETPMRRARKYSEVPYLKVDCNECESIWKTAGSLVKNLKLLLGRQPRREELN